MDCPCEENLIRMKLDGDTSILNLDFNLSGRTLIVTHSGGIDTISERLNALSLGSQLQKTEVAEGVINTEDTIKQQKALWVVLVINSLFFLIEMLSGVLSESMGLVADSLDMLADALVYGMSLMVVGAVVSRKKKVALFSGVLQLALAVLGLTEVIRRFLGFETHPDFQTMIGISLLALVANAVCLWILHRTKSNDAHMKASIIFSANDVIINLGVIVAGALVWLSKNNLPDLIVGVIIFLIVIRGALRILKLAK